MLVHPNLHLYYSKFHTDFCALHSSDKRKRYIYIYIYRERETKNSKLKTLVKKERKGIYFTKKTVPNVAGLCDT